MRRLWIITGIMVVLILILWTGLFHFHNRQKNIILQSWNLLQTQVVKSAGRAVENLLKYRLMEDGTDRELAEQQALEEFVKPIQVLESGHPWFYNRSYVIYHGKKPLPEEYRGKNIAQVFKMQEKKGARDFEKIQNAVLNGTEGTGSYVWSSDRGAEIASWTSIHIGHDTWSLGISTPEKEIFELFGIRNRLYMQLVVIFLLTVFIAILFAMVWKQEKRNRVVVKQMAKTANELSLKNEEYKLQIKWRKQAEEERFELIRELEEKNAEMEMFTYAVSHDLKSPLVTILGFLGMIEQDAVEGNMDRLRKDLSRISNAAEKMQQLLEELLELSRVGRIANPTTKINFTELAKEAAYLNAGRIKEKKAQIAIQPKMPTILGDKPRLLQVMQNLVDNGVKYMGDQPKPRVEVGCRKMSNEYVFFVRDNGKGIDPRYHSKIFGLFDRLDNETEGTGVGLAMVKRIIGVHGGKIWLESDGKGNGTTFYFTLPGKKPEKAEAPDEKT